MRVGKDKTRPSDDVLKECHYTNVIPRHDTIEDVGLFAHVGSVDSKIGEVHQSLVQANILLMLVEGCTTINVLAFQETHGPGSSSCPENALVPIVCKLYAEVFFECMIINFLEADEIGVLQSDIL